MARGFKTIDQELGWPGPPGKFGDFVQVDIGWRTGWTLVAEYVGLVDPIWICVDHPVSYRVHDEREIFAYWARRAEEGVPISFAYELEESAYLSELRQGPSGVGGRNVLRHFLMGGQNICLEVIATNLPIVSLSAPVRASEP